ncbi:MAG: excisionase family DNA binding protein [Parvibaculaceae bacterium]|jgi:excisionase family DNA binding protein
MRSNLLSPKTVSDILGVTVGTLAVWRTTNRYNLPYVKSGRLVRYREQDVEAFIASRVCGENNQ